MTYGTSRANAFKLIEDALNLKDTKIFDYVIDGDGKKKAYFPKVNFVRYADDFIVTGESAELLENGVKPIITEFLSKRGLEMSEEKTLITHK